MEQIDQALAIFQAEYAKQFPQGGDEADHVEATRCGVEAVMSFMQPQTPKDLKIPRRLCAECAATIRGGVGHHDTCSWSRSLHRPLR